MYWERGDKKTIMLFSYNRRKDVRSFFILAEETEKELSI